MIKSAADRPLKTITKEKTKRMINAIPSVSGLKSFLNLVGLLVVVSVTTQGAAVQSAPVVTSVTPINGIGSPQTFTAVYTDPAGNTDLSNVYMLFTSTLSDSGGCFIIYVRGINTMYLLNDSGLGVSGTVTPGVAGSVSNGQCTVSNAGT